jgi:predicted nucleic acid-binding protein
MLDTNVLLEVCTPGRHKDAKKWFSRLLLVPSLPDLLVSVLVEFELRRALDSKGATKSLEHFEEMSKSLKFVPVSAEATRRAAALSSTVEPRISGADAILAAQALVEGAVLITADEGLRTVPGLEARHWNEVDPDRLA